MISVPPLVIVNSNSAISKISILIRLESITYVFPLIFVHLHLLLNLKTQLFLLMRLYYYVHLLTHVKCVHDVIAYYVNYTCMQNHVTEADRETV